MNRTPVGLAESEARVKDIINVRDRLEPHDWWRLLGHNWVTFEFHGGYREALRSLLAFASRAELDAMMTIDERHALAALPEAIEVFRGCYPSDEQGLRWYTQRDAAESIPRQAKYWQNGTPCLVCGDAARRRAVLKLNSGTVEIVTPMVQNIFRIDLPALPIGAMPDGRLV